MVQVSYPTDGSPWGVHITGPYPDGVTYLLSYMSGQPTVGPADQLPNPDTSKAAAWARLSTKPGVAGSGGRMMSENVRIVGKTFTLTIGRRSDRVVLMRHSCGVFRHCPCPRTE